MAQLRNERRIFCRTNILKSILKRKEFNIDIAFLGRLLSGSLHPSFDCYRDILSFMWMTRKENNVYQR